MQPSTLTYKLQEISSALLWVGAVSCAGGKPDGRSSHHSLVVTKSSERCTVPSAKSCASAAPTCNGKQQAGPHDTSHTSEQPQFMCSTPCAIFTSKMLVGLCCTFEVNYPHFTLAVDTTAATLQVVPAPCPTQTKALLSPIASPWCLQNRLNAGRRAALKSQSHVLSKPVQLQHEAKRHAFLLQRPVQPPAVQTTCIA